MCKLFIACITVMLVAKPFCFAGSYEVDQPLTLLLSAKNIEMEFDSSLSFSMEEIKFSKEKGFNFVFASILSPEPDLDEVVSFDRVVKTVESSCDFVSYDDKLKARILNCKISIVERGLKYDAQNKLPSWDEIEPSSITVFEFTIEDHIEGKNQVAKLSKNKVKIYLMKGQSKENK